MLKYSKNLLSPSFTLQQPQLVHRLLLEKKQNIGATHQPTTSMPIVMRMGTMLPDSVMEDGLIPGPGKYAQRCNNNGLVFNFL